MATPGEKLAESLQALKKLQDKDNSLVIYGTTQLSRTHRDRLKMNGWLQEVLKGWYIVSKPGEEGDTTVWYSSFWNFIKAYCNRKYGNQWVLSPELSLDRWSGSTVIASQYFRLGVNSRRLSSRILCQESMSILLRRH